MKIYRIALEIADAQNETSEFAFRTLKVDAVKLSKQKGRTKIPKVDIQPGNLVFNFG